MQDIGVARQLNKHEILHSRKHPTLQVGKIMLSPTFEAWEISDMTSIFDLRGRALYDALMKVKPDGLAETEWASRAGVNRGFFTNLKASDISPRGVTLQKLLSVAGIEDPQAATIDTAIPGGRAVTDIVPAEDVVHIQKLDLSLSMGPGTLIEDWVESEPVAFDLAFIQAITRTPSNRLKLVTGIGDSMYPTLNWGDVILIDTTERQLARQDGVYWIDVYGAAGLKRLRNIGRDRVLVISDNPTVPDMEVDAADVRIQGRAIWLARGI